MKKIKLGYCVLTNPFSEEGETMIFVSKADSPTLNTEIFDQPAYNQVCILLKRLGFVQTELLTFENIRGSKVDITHIKGELELHGLTYNKNLEASLRKELRDVAKEAEKELIREATLNDSVVEVSHYLKTKKEQMWPIKVNPQRIPEYGEVVELYFYLFLESSLLKDGEILFMLNGDFYSKKGDKQRKFVKIVSCKFRRIDTGNPKELHLESISKYRDFIADIDCLYTANLEFQPQGLIGYENAPLKKNYSIMEIKNVMNLDNYIVVNVNTIANYNKLVGWSNKIQNELKEIKDNTVPVNFLVAKLQDIKTRLERRMDYAIEKEEYEVAQTYLESIKALEDRIGWLNESGKDELNLMEYDKHMAIGYSEK